MNEPEPLLNISTQKMKTLVRNGPLTKSQEVKKKINPVVSALIIGDKEDTRRLSGADLKVLVTSGEKLKNVSKLVLEKITNEDIMFIKNTIHGDKGPADFGIADILELIISPSDGNAVRSLNLLGISGLVCRAQVLRIALLFPNLKTAEFHILRFTSWAIRQLFISFPMLEFLCFYQTPVKNLKGIGNLQNLLVLVLCQNEFDSPQAIIDVFKLKKLQVLHLSGEGSRPPISLNLTHFLKCNQSLPELRLLDITSNVIDEDQLNRLMELHPKLRMIGLITTSLEKHPQLKNSDCALLTLESLETCIKALDHYNQKGTWNRMITAFIHAELIRIQNEEYERQSQDMLRSAVNTILTHKNPNQHEVVVWLLINLLKNERHEMFNDGEIIVIVRALLLDWPAVWEEGEVEINKHPELRNQARREIWRLAVSKRTLPFNRSLLGPIMQRASWTLKHFRDTVFVENIDLSLEASMDALFRCITRHRDNNNPFFKNLYNDNKLKLCLIQLMDRLNFRNQRFCNFNYWLIVVARVLFCETNTHEESARIRQATKTAATSIKALEQMPEARQTAIFKILHHTLRTSKLDYNMFFKEPQFSILTEFINSHQGFLAPTIDLFVALQFLKRGGDRRQLLQKLDACRAMRSEILNDVKTYKRNQPAADSLILFKWLSLNGSRATATFANWMLEHFENEEVLRTKRRRLER